MPQTALSLGFALVVDAMTGRSLSARLADGRLLAFLRVASKAPARRRRLCPGFRRPVAFVLRCRPGNAGVLWNRFVGCLRLLRLLAHPASRTREAATESLAAAAAIRPGSSGRTTISGGGRRRNDPTRRSS